MRLTNYSDYALRILMYLAVMPPSNDLATIADIADSYQISKSHLTKIVHQLAQLGYIDSVRGKNGGIRLAMAADKINLGQILRHTEPDFDIVPCFQQVSMQNTSNDINDADSTNIQQLSCLMPTIETVNRHTFSPSKSLCAINPSCLLKGLLHEATQAFITVMDSYTLADITHNESELRQLLF